MPANEKAAAASWQAQYDEVLQFTTQHGRLPRQREPGGKWLAKQRERDRSAKQPPERADLLAQLPGYRVGEREGHFDDRLAEVERFVERHGRLPVKNEPGHEQLAQWLRDVRRGRSRPAPERTARLEALPGFSWAPQDDEFLAGFTRFQDYLARYGMTWVRIDFACADGYPLGVWARDRRKARAQMPAEQRGMLDQAGFCWERPVNADQAPRSEGVGEPASTRAATLTGRSRTRVR